jgi:hypothetical protein
MCTVFNGVEYHHGIRVAKPTETGLRYFDIMTTKHVKNQPYRYSGICLNNGYEVCTNKYSKPEALLELLDKIVADTLATEKEYPVRYPGESFIPVGNIQEKDPGVYEDFSIKMQYARSLEEYGSLHEKIKPFLEKPRYDPTSNEKATPAPSCVKPDWPMDIIYDCKEMYLTLHFAKENDTLKDCKIEYARV